MPRAPRRPAVEQPAPPMVNTPPQRPLNNAPTYNPGASIIPTQNNRNDAPDGSQASTHALSDEFAEQSHLSSLQAEAEDAKALIGLRDISSLATWTLSSAKPGCALAQLRNPSPGMFWQSDGPQPHTLTLHFFKLVAIVKMRIYLDFDLDESYTPTRMKFFAGMSEGGLVEFGEWAVTEITDENGEVRSSVENVKGWIDVDLKGVGGREKRYFEVAEEEEGEVKPGDVLKAMVVQVRICENHQNGKDTHVRGFQVFSRDEAMVRELVVGGGKLGSRDEEGRVVGLKLAEWMKEPEIR